MNLSQITVRFVSSTEESRFQDLMDSHHYLTVIETFKDIEAWNRICGLFKNGSKNYLRTSVINTR